MPKTNFIDGATTVAASFLNKIFAHNHKGLDEDGSAPKINLATEAVLDTAGQPLKAPGHAVAWLTFTTDNVGNFTVVQSVNLQATVGGGAADFKRELISNVRTDLDGTPTPVDMPLGVHVSWKSLPDGGKSTNGIRVLNAYSQKGVDNKERIFIDVYDLTGAPSSLDNGYGTITVYGLYPNGIG